MYREDIADDPEVVGRFEADARLLVDLDHPGLVRVYDAWREPGVAVIVMRRLVGGTLRDRLDDGSLSGADAMLVIRRVGAALLALARRGRAHGRVRPGNVLFDADGLPYLSDPSLSGSGADGRGRLGLPASRPDVSSRDARRAAGPALAGRAGRFATSVTRPR